MCERECRSLTFSAKFVHGVESSNEWSPTSDRTRTRRMGAPVAWLALVVLVGGARGEVPVPRCPPAAAERCRKLGAGPNEYYFNVDDLNFIYSYSDGNYLSLKCPREGIGPEDPALPRFEPELVVGKVSVECPLPAAPYTAVLRAINVAPPARLIVKGGRLLRAHLADAALLRSLDLIGVELEPGALAAAARLTALYVEKVNLTGGELERLPAGLAALHLRQTGVGLVSRDALRRLPALETLLVRGERDVRLQTDAAAALRSLSVTANKARLDPRLPPTLENVTVGGWTPERPEPWAACAGLVRLTLDKPDAAELPAGWVAGCDRLRELEVCDARRPLKLVAGALRGARALRRLRLARCALRELPSGLLDDARDLSYLDLSDNHLLALPSGLLRYSKRSLSALRLSRNLFDGSVLRSLEELASLETLHLNDNEALDACPAPNIANDTIHVPLAPASSLRRLVALRLLALDGTRTARVCSDWRDLPRLRALSLRRSRLAALTYTDLRFASTTDVKIFLCGANVTSLVFEREDYVRVIDPDWARVTVQLDATLVRDCSLYWAAAALRRPGTRVLHKPCATTIGVKLADESLDELVCPRPCRYAANCSCAVREDHAPPGRLLRLDCSGAAHTRVPPLDLHAALDAAPGERYRVDLLLAGNRVADLRPEDLPPDLATLDLRNNSLTLIDAATASTLIRRPELKVLLAGNELECGCDALAALGVVRARPEMFVDRFEATCASGRALAVAAAAPPCAAPVSPLAAAWALVGLAVLAPVALAALALLRPGLRLRLKAALRARGLIPPAPELEDGRRYDAFVSFAHADESVVRELAARLESGAAPLRLCLHYRDWAPGGWIPAQIAASVRESRRTVAVVSAEFLRSAWARAEFREAHAAALRDARPRLVVVLLDEPARLPLDPELRAYLADNTYVRWGDPWFWDKLRRALPTPRPRAPDPPAALPDGGPPAHSPRSPPAA